MAMVNLALTAQEAKDTYGSPSPAVEDAPKYPYGLCIYLNEATLEKLGLSEMPAVGSVIDIVSKAKVTAISEREQQDGDTERTLDLQITDLDMGGERTDQADRMFGAKSAS